MLPGDTIADRFVIEREAGSGGMGTVYRAVDRHTRVPVALKVLRQQSPSDAQRFARETDLLAQIAHPGIVGYVAHGTTDEGAPYLAMEWLAGETLGDRLALSRLSIAESVTVALRVAEALGLAHRKGVVHRDIKPSNLFLPDGDLAQVKILDFGIARQVGGGEGRPLTLTGALIGTPGYMGPEQARGSREIGPATDVFALGCVLYECLAGQPAFISEHLVGLLARILLDEPPRVSDASPEVPEALAAIVTRMLAKEPADRPADGDAVADALRPFATERQAKVASAGPLTPVPRGLDSRRITGTEQRVICVLLAANALKPEWDAPTVRPEEASGRVSALRAALRNYGARLEPLADGSVALTVAGVGAATDQAAVAARCALHARALLPHAPMALATGRAVVAGNAPMGEAIDRAVRALRRLADGPSGAPTPIPLAPELPPVDAIRIDETTTGLLDARFEVAGDAYGLYLRGERDVEVTRTLLGKPTECLGRDRELAALDGIFDECVAEPVARAALITAAPGLGKSRLRYELLRRLKARGTTPELLILRGESLSAGAPFGLLAPALRRLCGIVDGEPLDVRQRKLRARVGRHLAPRAVARVSEFLGELAGVPFPDTGSQALRAARADLLLMGDAMRTAWLDWLEAECAVQPLLVLIEDLHWGDLPTVKFVDAALRTLRDRPFMVLALARPDVHQLFPALWAEHAVQEFALGPLGKKAAEGLARAVLGETADAATITRIVELADGNVFYLEELVRAVAAGQADALPDTVLAMVQARLDALGQEARKLLRAGSVFGERFWRGGALALVYRGGAATRAADGALADLCARELITRRAIASLPGETEYVFRNTLVREAAYAMLTDEDRALGHRLAGGWLEDAAHAGPENLLGVDASALAEHFALGRDPARALVWYRRGAEQAMEGNDFEAVLERAEKGIRCGAEGELLGILRLLQAEAYAWRGERGEAKSAAEAAAARLPRGSALWFRVVAELITSAGRHGEHAHARSWAREAEGVGPQPGADGAQIACLARAAQALIFAGRSALASELLARVEKLAPDLAALDRAVAARVHEVTALVAYFSGDPAGNLNGLEAAFAAYDAAGDARNACRALGYLGFAYVELGDLARAEEVLLQARATADRMGLGVVMANTLSNLGMVVARRGDPARGRELEERALTMFQALGEPRTEGSCRVYLAGIALLAGDPAEAARQARQAVDLLAAVGPSKAGALATLARALLALGKPEEALPPAWEAMSLLESLGTVDEGEALIRLVLAEALHAAGDGAGAHQAILGARDRLLARAGRITDEAWRQSFLTRVPDNAATLRRAEEWANLGD